MSLTVKGRCFMEEYGYSWKRQVITLMVVWSLADDFNIAICVNRMREDGSRASTCVIDPAKRSNEAWFSCNYDGPISQGALYLNDWSCLLLSQRS